MENVTEDTVPNIVRTLIYSVRTYNIKPLFNHQGYTLLDQ